MGDNLRIALVGQGNVGTALRRGLSAVGHKATAVGRDPDGIRKAAAAADVVILAVPFAAREEALRSLGRSADGKVLVDVTNALDAGAGFAGSLEQSGAEQVQEWLPRARVVKAFNTVFAQHMETGQVQGESLTVFAAGNERGARDTVLGLARDIGFEAVDAGPLETARWLETLGYLNITLGYRLGLGVESGFRYVHRPPMSGWTPPASARKTLASASGQP